MLTPQKLIWVKTPFSQERGEFLRVAEEFTPGVDHNNRKLRRADYQLAVATNLEYLKKHYGDNPSTLSDAIWRRLENSDSYKTTTPDKVEEAVRINRLSSGNRDVSAIIDEYNTGRIRAPIIMVYDRDRYTLVAGNTRLMVARAGNIIPKVVFVHTDW